MEVLMAYKPTVQIEKELKSDKAWQKAVEPKAKAMIKQAHNVRTTSITQPKVSQRRRER